MRRLPHREFDRLSHFLLDLYQFRDHETFVAHTLQALHRLVPCERVSYNEMDIENQTVYAKSNLGDPRLRELDPIFAALMHQHPSIRHLQADQSRDRSALRISDFLPDRQFLNLPLYQEYFRHVDTTHQLAVLVDGQANDSINLALNRHKRDFSDDEHVMLTLLRPHLVLAYHNAKKASQVIETLSGLATALTATGVAAIRVDRQGRILWMTEHAEGVLRTYCQATSAESLPAMIREWFHAQASTWLDHAAHLPSSQPLTLHHQQGTLTLSLVRDEQNEVEWWVLLQERRVRMHRDHLKEAGLTARETEVLQWVAQGKTNGEIAIILGTKPATIKKHLERIYSKLGVETRTAAVAYLNGFHSET